MIDPVVVCRYGLQDLWVARPHDEAAPDAEVALHVLLCFAVHLRYEPAGSNAVLPVYNVELFVLDLLLGRWLGGSIGGHHAHCLGCRPVRQVE